MTRRTSAEFAVVLADLLTSARDEGCDIGEILSMAGERIGPVDTTVDIGTNYDRKHDRPTLHFGGLVFLLPRIRRATMIDWNPEWTEGFGAPPGPWAHATMAAGAPPPTIYELATANAVTEHMCRSECRRATVDGAETVIHTPECARRTASAFQARPT